jgi:hypothetical protein
VVDGDGVSHTIQMQISGLHRRHPTQTHSLICGVGIGFALAAVAAIVATVKIITIISMIHAVVRTFSSLCWILGCFVVQFFHPSVMIEVTLRHF